MSLPDTIFIFALALVIFGPRKLPEIGRQVGKLLFEFRRASNEFKLQIEEELRAAEAADREARTAVQAPAAPAAPLAAGDSSGSLTIRPPTTGSIVSAGPAEADAAVREGAIQESEPASAEFSPSAIGKGPNGHMDEDAGQPEDRNQPGGEPVHNYHG